MESGAGETLFLLCLVFLARHCFCWVWSFRLSLCYFSQLATEGGGAGIVSAPPLSVLLAYFGLSLSVPEASKRVLATQ